MGLGVRATGPAPCPVLTRGLSVADQFLEVDAQLAVGAAPPPHPQYKRPRIAPGPLVVCAPPDSFPETSPSPASSASADGNRRRRESFAGLHPGGTATAALRCCAMQETRLDTVRIRAARRVIDPIFSTLRCTAVRRWSQASGARSASSSKRRTRCAASRPAARSWSRACSPRRARGRRCAPARATSAKPSPGPVAAGDSTSPSWPPLRDHGQAGPHPRTGRSAGTGRRRPRDGPRPGGGHRTA